MTGLLQDIRYAVRQLRKSPAFAAVSVITLAMGIGANTAIFSVVEAVMLRALPYAHPKQLVLLSDAQDPENGGFLLEDIDPLRSQSRSFSDIAFYYRDSGFSTVTLTPGTEPESVQGAFVSSNLFDVMGIAPTLGRTFTTDEENRRERIVVLSHGLWAKRFGYSADVIGKDLNINGESFQIVGVMPATFQFPAPDQQFWAPVTTNRFWDDPFLRTVDPTHSRYAYERWQAVGRLHGNTSIAQAQSEVNTIFSRLSHADADPNRGVGITVTPVRVTLTGNTRTALIVLFCAVFFVLVIACSNVATLALARSSVREREIAVRSALGAAPSRLARQLLTESVVLAFIGGVAGIGLAALGQHSLITLAPSGIPRIEQTRMDFTMLVFALGISAFSAIAFGLAPAWTLSRKDPNASLKPALNVTRPARGWAASGLVVGQFAIAVVLLAGAGLLVRSLLALHAVDPGFRPEHVLTVDVSLASGTPAARNALYDEVLDRARHLPGVEAAGAMDTLFELGNVSNLGLRAIEGRSPEPKERWTPLSWVAVRGDSFKSVGTDLLRGRYFTSGDGPRSSLVAIIDESMARRYWPGENPIGKRFKGQDARGQNDDWLTVVGVVRDMRLGGLEKSPIPHVFEPSTQAIDGDRTEHVVVRTHGDPAVLSADLRSTIRSLSGTAIISGVSTMKQQLNEQLAPRRFQTLLLGAFAAVALALATLGILGLMHYSVAQRTREIGIRAALGARPSDILRSVLLQAGRLAFAGIAVGLCGAWILTRFMQTLLFGIGAVDPATFIAAPLLLTAAALLASFIPARRAARVDPMVALRYE